MHVNEIDCCFYEIGRENLYYYYYYYYDDDDDYY